MNDSVLIRPAKLVDLSQIVKVDGDAFRSTAYGWLPLRQLFDLCGKFFLVAETEKIVGYSVGGIEPETGRGWILSLGVSSDARKLGIGTKLTGELLKELFGSDAKYVDLTVEPHKDSLIKLYQKCGFTEISEEQNYFGPNQHRILMRYSPK
jgi:ribosomal-protein-alanine N-acetyltransferase